MFTINGVDAQPKYSVPINKEQPTPIIIEWQVVGGKDIKGRSCYLPQGLNKEGNSSLSFG